MEKPMKRQLPTLVATLFTATGALAANVSSVARTNVDEDYQATPVYSAAAHNLSEAGWYAGLTLTWNRNSQRASNTQTTLSDNIGAKSVSFTGNNAPSGSGIANTTTTSWAQQYFATTTWYFSVTPEMMYECFKADKDYEITFTVGDNTYTVTVPKDVELLKDDVKWYPAVGLLDAKVYGDAQLLADQITLDNYQNVKFLVDPSDLTFPEGFAGSDEVDGEWGVKMLHNHDWAFAVVEGTNLVATCGTANCPYNGGELRMCLAVETAEKTYDGASVTYDAMFGDYFKVVFPNVSTSITVDDVENGVIRDAGEHAVALSVSGLGDGETYVLSTTVTIDPKDITGATLVLTPASTTYNAAEQTVTPSVTVDRLAATLEVAEGSTTAATEIGAYSVTVNGTGNFTGTASATWNIVNTTGSLNGVAATTSADAGSYAGNTLTVTDTTVLAYADNGWTAGLTFTWPLETKNWQLLSQNSYAYYVTTNDVKITAAVGEIEHSTLEGSYTTGYNQTSRFNYLATTTWTVGLTPAAIEAALAEDKAVLEYTVRAGAIQSATYANGVAFADYTIALPLDEPVLFVLGENETHDLGDTVLTTTKIMLAPGASVASAAEQGEGAIFTEANGCEVVFADGKYTCRKTIVDDESASAGYMDGDKAIVTNSVNSVTIPEGAASVEVVLSGETATLKSENADLGITIYATDENGVRQEKEITGAFSVKYEDGAYTVALDPDEVTPEIGEVDFSNAGAAAEGMALTVNGAFEGLWYGVGVSDEPAGDFPVDAGSIVQAGAGETLNLVTPPSTADKKFYRIKVAPSKAALGK